MEYRDAGVHLDLGDTVSEILYNAAKKTWENRKGMLGEVIVPFDNFTGFRAVDVSRLPEGTFMNIGFDGVGTKIEVAERMRDHRTVAHDLFAMVCDDAVVRGAEPVLVGSILDVRSLKDEHGQPYLDEVRQLAQGYIEAAKLANVAVVNGEVAELGDRVHGYEHFNYNWGAGVVWFAHKDRILTGHRIQAGDALVGFQEEGFRSNGLSLVRKILRQQYGDMWHATPWKRGDTTFGSMTLTPSKIYTRAVVDMFGGYDKEPQAELHGVVHVTGGGIPGKLGRALKPTGLGAVLDTLFDPPEFMFYVQALGNVPDKEVYRTWNMGCGMIIITPEPDKVINIARNNSIQAQHIGHVQNAPGIYISNHGAFATLHRQLYLDYTDSS